MILKIIKGTDRSKTTSNSDFMGRASSMLSWYRKEPEAMEGTFPGGSLGFGCDSWGLLMLALALTQGALQAVFDSRSSCISKNIFLNMSSWYQTQEPIIHSFWGKLVWICNWVSFPFYRVGSSQTALKLFNNLYVKAKEAKFAGKLVIWWSSKKS